MSKSKLNDNDVYHNAASFRSAIIVAKRSGEFEVPFFTSEYTRE